MLKPTYTAKSYSPEKVMKRYVRCDGDGFAFCEVGEDKRYDLRQGKVDAADIPEPLKESAKERYGQAFSYVEWPI